MSDAEVNNGYQIRGQNPLYLWLGGAAACLIPMGFGLAFIWPLADYLWTGCHEIQHQGRGCRSFRQNSDYWYFEFPLAMTFLLATPIVAGISAEIVRDRIRVNPMDYKFLDSVLIGIKSASIAHLICAFLAPVLLVMFGIFAVPDAIMATFVSVIFHIPLFLFVTLPLSALCAAIFQLVALTSIKNSQTAV